MSSSSALRTVPSARATASMPRATISACPAVISVSWKNCITVLLSRSASRPDGRAQSGQLSIELVDAELGVFLRKHAPIRCLEDGHELHVLEHFDVAARQVVADGLGEMREGDARLARVVVREQNDRFDVGVGVTDEPRAHRAAILRELDLAGDLVLAQLGHDDRFDLGRLLRIKKGDLPIEPSGALDVDVEL